MPTRRCGFVLAVSMLFVFTACAPVFATGTMRGSDATIGRPVPAKLLHTDSATSLTAPESTVAILPADHQADGDDPVGHVIVFPLVILAAVVLVAATVGLVGLATGHH